MDDLILFDIETVADPSVPPPPIGSPPSTWKDPAKIAQWKVEAQAKAAKKMSLSPTTGVIVLVSALLGDRGIVQFTGVTEFELLADFGLWLRDQRGLSDAADRRAVCAYNGTGFDFSFVAWRAARLGQFELAQSVGCSRKWGDRYHVDPFPQLQAPLGVAARSLGHEHPSMSGGSQVGQWWKGGNMGAILSHGMDDIRALQVVAAVALRAGMIRLPS